MSEVKSAQTPKGELRVERVSFAPRLFRSSGQQADGFQSTQNLLTDISFTVHGGDRLALVGASGAGKSLLLRLLNRLNEPTQGTIFWRDRAYSQIPPVQLRQQVVLVLQESKLLGMTVQQALEYPLRLRQLPQVAMRQRLNEWTDRLQIPAAWRDRTEFQLSLGQRQWVAIARALLTQPAVLLLDEPTAALDLGRSQHLLQVLAEVAQKSETKILMTNHQLELAQAFGTRVLHLERGKLVQDRSASQMDWAALRQTLLQAETQDAQEWD